MNVLYLELSSNNNNNNKSNSSNNNNIQITLYSKVRMKQKIKK